MAATPSVHAAASEGAQAHYLRVNGWVTGCALAGQLPAAVAATVLYRVGGFQLVGAVSIAVCLASAGVAATVPEAARAGTTDDGPGYGAVLLARLRVAAARPGVPALLCATALLGSLDTLEEYFPLLLGQWGVPVAAVPLAGLPIVVSGAVGAALAGLATQAGRRTVAGMFLGASAVLLAAGLAGNPAGRVAVAVFYGVYRAVLVVVDGRLQERVDSGSRATVTSVAALGTDLASFGVYAAWAVGQLPVAAVLCLATAAVLPRLLRTGRPAPAPTRSAGQATLHPTTYEEPS